MSKAKKRTKEVKKVEKLMGLTGFKDMPIPTSPEEAITYNKKVFQYFLKKVKATRVEIRYEGGGDNGSIESVTVYKPKPEGEVGQYGETEDEVNVDKIQVEYYSINTRFDSSVPGNWKTNVEAKKDNISQVLENFAYELLATQPFDWINNEGGFGTINYDVLENTLSMDHSQRTTESHSAEW